jgi:Flp pilus assembly protein TadG
MRGKRRRAQEGQTYLEFVLVFPILALTILTFLDLARAVFYYNSVSRAARAGARYAIVHSCAVADTCDTMLAIQAAQELGGAPPTCADAYPGDAMGSAVRYWLPGLDANDVTISCTWTGQDDEGFDVQIQVQAIFRPVVPLINGLTPFTLTAQSAMTITF